MLTKNEQMQLKANLLIDHRVNTFLISYSVYGSKGFYEKKNPK